MKCSKQPRPPTSQERQELTDYLELEVELSGRDEVLDLGRDYVLNALISVFDHYRAADGSYTGKIMLVVWRQRVDCFQLYICNAEGLDRVEPGECFEIL